MYKVAVFTEGLGESLFVRHLLLHMINPNDLSFECFKLIGDDSHSVPYKYSPPSAIIHYQIINVGNDEKVLSSILERCEKLVNAGYEIVGLRDMYSNAYKKRSETIDQATNDFFEKTIRDLINRNPNAGNIKIFFAIMEFEAWLLGMYSLFEKINALLTCEFIKQNISIQLDTVNPEIEFFHPAIEFGNILGLVGEKYNKSKDQMESILSHMDIVDVINAYENGRCSKFKLFIKEIENQGSKARI